MIEASDLLKGDHSIPSNNTMTLCDVINNAIVCLFVLIFFGIRNDGFRGVSSILRVKFAIKSIEKF